eukprot:5006525-Prymnesium_polylepis.1
MFGVSGGVGRLVGMGQDRLPAVGGTYRRLRTLDLAPLRDPPRAALHRRVEPENRVRIKRRYDGWLGQRLLD